MILELCLGRDHRHLTRPDLPQDIVDLRKVRKVAIKDLEIRVVNVLIGATEVPVGIVEEKVVKKFLEALDGLDQDLEQEIVDVQGHILEAEVDQDPGQKTGTIPEHMTLTRFRAGPKLC